eukprot:gene4769-3430_t
MRKTSGLFLSASFFNINNIFASITMYIYIYIYMYISIRLHKIPADIYWKLEFTPPLKAYSLARTPYVHAYIQKFSFHIYIIIFNQSYSLVGDFFYIRKYLARGETFLSIPSDSLEVVYHPSPSGGRQPDNGVPSPYAKEIEDPTEHSHRAEIVLFYIEIFMRCFQCDLEEKRFETLFAPTEVPDKYKTRCFHCKGQLSDRELKNLLATEEQRKPKPILWDAPPMPPTKKEEERMRLEREELQRIEDAERARLEWEEQHETTSFNILVRPPIIYGGAGEQPAPMLERIFTSSINDLERLNDPLPMELLRAERQRQLEAEKLIVFLVVIYFPHTTVFFFVVVVVLFFSPSLLDLCFMACGAVFYEITAALITWWLFQANVNYLFAEETTGAKRI